MSFIKKAFLFLLVAVLAACSSSPSDEDIQAAIQQTQEAAPPTAEPTETPAPAETSEPTETPAPTETSTPTETPKPTQIPLSSIDLESIVLRDGELPEHLQRDFFVEGLDAQNVLLGELPEGEQIVTQKFYNSERDSGGGAAIIFLYDDLTLVQNAFDHAAGNLDFLNFDADVGEQSKAENNPPQWHLTFTRCHAFVYIFMIDGREFDIVSYAEALDTRLAESVCNK